MTPDPIHALQIANHVDYLGGMPSVTPKAVKTSEKAEDMLKFDLENETVTIRNYRRRVKQADALNEFAIAESLRGILVQEQDHLIALATARASKHPTLESPTSSTALRENPRSRGSKIRRFRPARCAMPDKSGIELSGQDRSTSTV